jgi:hypothetical protein
VANQALTEKTEPIAAPEALPTRKRVLRQIVKLRLTWHSYGTAEGAPLHNKFKLIHYYSD